MIQIYHNPRCGKSRNCLAFVEDKKLDFEIIKYLDTPPSKEELTELLKKLQIKPIELVRQKEKIWIENYKNQSLTDDDIIKILSTHPILIERPIVISGDMAIIGREIDKLNSFI
ncbi:arsenate reductase (glutaredoxin) [Flavobacterium sp. NG2]|uniref:arsenate reductase (glutaredoxin) n=1 Tax=Flavobacterium sp. NG2 TaxID=3097547 RepID=UPI002A828249|nr:arsenate reductase (glutaredoxin) [Flavobacterium sp. NG2]WPR70532.1 arsenate reductase (glutaredoxin) [Flavobacterium sp. NG2]